MTQPISSFKRPVFTLTFALLLAVPLIGFSNHSAFAQAGAPTGGAAGGSETCSDENMQRLEAQAHYSANQQNEVLTTAVQPPPTTTDLTCIDETSLHNADKGTEIFSNNDEFCDGPCDSELIETMTDGSISSLDLMQAANEGAQIVSLFQKPSLANIVQLLGGVFGGGINLPQSCDGPEQYGQEVWGRVIDPALTRSGASLAGAGIGSVASLITGAHSAAVSRPSVPEPQPVAADPIETTLPPKGTCEWRDDPDGNARNCICGPETIKTVSETECSGEAIN